MKEFYGGVYSEYNRRVSEAGDGEAYYLCRVGLLTVRGTLCQARESRTQSHVSLGTTGSISPSPEDFVGDLRLDDITTEFRGTIISHCVTFFRTSTLFSSKISVGLWVLVGREMSGESQLSCSCFAQIVELSLSPLYIKLRLAGGDSGSIPACMRQCASRQKHWRWKVSMLGNVTEFQRVFFSLNRILCDRSCAPLLGIVSQTDAIVHAKHHLHKLLKEDYKKCETESNLHTTLNLEQQEAVSRVMNSIRNDASAVILIEGPPGTGNKQSNN